MICPACQHENAASAKFCGQCGAPLSSTGDQATRLTSGPVLGETRPPTSPVARSDAPTLPPPTSAPPTGQPGPGSSAATGPLTPGQAFGTRYHIIKLLGVGGMGAVYQAWDDELGVSVALKVIKPEVGLDPDAARDVERRFKRELLLARQVTHKNVVRIHDLGELDGIKYITMPYVDGADLAQVLKNEGRLAVPRAVSLAKQIAAGLQAAHEMGIVHRDLKPANVMIDDERALIMDFGIARSVAGATMATVAGSVMGTIEYMAPEQARGEAVDQRADIYAFGLIVYDMLLGARRASATTSPVSELMGRMQKGVPSVRSLDPQVPENLDAVIARCVQADPAARFQTTAELVAALDRLGPDGRVVAPSRVVRRLRPALLAGVSMLALTLVAGTWWLARRTAEPAAPVQHEPVSVLVANFVNKTGDPVFQGSLEQMLTLGIEGAPFITAYPRQSAESAARRIGSGTTLDEAGARLVSVREGIKIVLAGSIEKAGSGYELSVRAVDPAADKPLAIVSERAKDKEAVLGAIQDLASKIRTDLGDTTPEEARRADAETFTTTSIDAMHAYAHAQELARANRNDEALREYQRAISFDPNFGRAYAGIGVIETIYKDDAKAKEAYEQALKHLDRMTERERYRTLGTYYLSVARNYEKAIENFRTLVKLYPADRAGRSNLALAYLHTGNLTGAEEEVRKILEIYPKNSLQRYNYSMYSLYAGDFKTAIDEGTKVASQSPSFAYAVLPVALSKALEGDVAAATDAYQKTEAAGGDVGPTLARLGLADLDMYEGRYREAATRLQTGVSADPQAGDPGGLARQYMALGQAYLALGKKTDAAEAVLEAVGLSSHDSVLVPAARVLVATGRTDEARQIGVKLEKELQTQTVAYARLIDADIALERRDYADAVEKLRDSVDRRDTWLARYLLGWTYAQTGHFTEAMAELDQCLKRKGEAADVFFDDMPTLRYLPPVYYWLARSQQELGISEARNNYQQFLALRNNADPPDPLAADARQRLAALPPS